MRFSGECKSRTEICLPEVQQKLFERVYAVNPNVSVVLFQGRPLDIRAILGAKAIFTMWQPGTEGGRACADLLFGKSNFSGKLAMSFPYCVGQLPLYYNHYNTGRPFGRTEISTSGNPNTSTRPMRRCSISATG